MSFENSTNIRHDYYLSSLGSRNAKKWLTQYRAYFCVLGSQPLKDSDCADN